MKKFLTQGLFVFLFTLILNTSTQAALVIDMPGDYKFVGSLGFGTDTLTTDNAETGTATATLTVVSTYVITNATGALADIVTVPNGTFVGQQKQFTLYQDNETTGCSIKPTTKTVGTSTLLEDAWDVVRLEWTGSAWNVVSNIGGTEQ